MSLPYLILGLLESEPATGYAIQKQISQHLANFWQASHQQIYRDLSNMEKKGWVKFETIKQVGKPSRKLYQITKLGKKALQQWFITPVKTQTIKDEFLVKLLYASEQNKSDLLPQVEAKQAQLNAQISHLQEQLEQINNWQERLALKRQLFEFQSQHEWFESVYLELNQ